MRGDKIESKAKFEYDNRRSVSDRFCCPAYSDTIADPDVGNQRGDCCNSSDASDPRHDTLQRNLAGAGYPVQEKTEYTISGAIFTKENLLRLKPVIYIAMLIAYALLLPHIGFIISSLLLANGILLYFGTRKWWFYAIASANVIVAYFAFQAMSVTLP